MSLLSEVQHGHAMPDQSVNSVGHFTVVVCFFLAWKGVRLLGKNVVAETKADEDRPATLVG